MNEVELNHPKTNIIDVILSLGYEITKKDSRIPFDPKKLKFRPANKSRSTAAATSSVSNQTNFVLNANSDLASNSPPINAARPTVNSTNSVNRFEAHQTPATARGATSNDYASNHKNPISTNATCLPSSSNAPPNKWPSNAFDFGGGIIRGGGDGYISTAAKPTVNKPHHTNNFNSKTATNKPAQNVPNEYDQILDDDDFLMDDLPINEEDFFNHDLHKNGNAQTSSAIETSYARRQFVHSQRSYDRKHHTEVGKLQDSADQRLRNHRRRFGASQKSEI